MNPEGHDRRISPRRRVLKRATLRLTTGDIVISGLVRDVSDGGAKFVIETSSLRLGLGRTAQIEMEGAAAVECEIVREGKDGELGLRFYESASLHIPTTDVTTFYARESALPEVLDHWRKLNLQEFENIIARHNYLWSDRLRFAFDEMITSHQRFEALLHQYNTNRRASR